MNVLDRFQLERSLTDKSAEAEAQARKINEGKKRMQKLNQQNTDLKVKNYGVVYNKRNCIIFLPNIKLFCILLSSQSRQSWKQRQRQQPGRKLNYNQ